MTTSQILCHLSRHLAEVSAAKYYGIRCKDVTKELLGIWFISDVGCVSEQLCHQLLRDYSCDVVACGETADVACTLAITDITAAGANCDTMTIIA